MDEENRQQVAELFAALKSEIPAIAGLALVSADGRVLFQAWNDAISSDKAGAVSAAILGLGKKTIEVCSEGEFRAVVVQSSLGCISVYRSGDEAVLVALMNGHADLGLLNIRAREIGQSISNLFALHHA